MNDRKAKGGSLVEALLYHLLVFKVLIFKYNAFQNFFLALICYRVNRESETFPYCYFLISFSCHFLIL